MSWFPKRRRHTSGVERKSKQIDRTNYKEQLEATVPPSLPSQQRAQQVSLTGDNYGTRNPLDWESMPHSLQIKFPHWKEQNVPSPTLKHVSKEKADRTVPSPPLKKSGNIPENTIPYIVMECDTLASIALKFDTTTSDVARANNKLLDSSCLIYPGELLYIPDNSVENDNNIVNEEGKSEDHKEESVELKNDTNRETYEDEEVINEKEESISEEIVEDLYIQFPSKFMSEQLCVHGTLFFNPQSLMFKPRSDDPLVEDNGLGQYEVLIPFSEIVYSYITTNYSVPTSVTASISSPLPNEAHSSSFIHDPQIGVLSSESETGLSNDSNDHLVNNNNNSLSTSQPQNNDLNINIRPRDDPSTLPQDNPSIKDTLIQDDPSIKDTQSQDDPGINTQSQDDLGINAPSQESPSIKDTQSQEDSRSNTPSQDDPSIKDTLLQDDSSIKGTQLQDGLGINTQTQDDPSRDTQLQDDPCIKDTLLQDDPNIRETQRQDDPNIRDTQRQDDPIIRDTQPNDHNIRDTQLQDQSQADAQDDLTPRHTQQAQGDPTIKNTQQQDEPGTDSQLQNDPHTNNTSHKERVRSDTLNSLFQEEDNEKEPQTLEQFGDEPTPLNSLWNFLYVRVSQSAQQNELSPVIGIEIPHPRGQSSHSIDVQRVRTWFIFAFPTARSHDLFTFIFKHHPSSNTDANVASLSNSTSSQLVEGAKWEIINLKGQYSDDSLQISEKHFASSWEIFSVDDFQPLRKMELFCLPFNLLLVKVVSRKPSLIEMVKFQQIECMDVENSLPLPHLIESSDFLTTKHIRKLTLNLVSAAVGYDWYLIYSTMKHGISLQTLYRNMANFGDSPTILLVRDEFGKLFGAMLSCSIKRSDRFYGTGESLLFSFDEYNDITVYPWTGLNDYIIKGSSDSVAIGSGDGHFGLWLDEGFHHGSSFKCLTYDNETLSSSQDFIINGVEVWGFM